MTATPQTGAINAKFQPSFESQQIAIKTLPGKPVHSPYQGDQVMFVLTDGRRWFADPVIAQRLEQMRIQPGEVFAVQKVSYRDGTRAITKIEITAVVPDPADSQPANDSASHLTRCYRDAVDIAVSASEYARSKGLVIAPSFEDVRALAATICINERDGRRAA